MQDNLLRFDKTKFLLWIDAETENLCLNECNNIPWQIGLVWAKGNEILERENNLIKWPFKLNVSPRAAMITRFSQEKINVDGKDSSLVAKRVRESVVAADYICGHNILGFDIYLINSMLRRAGLEPYNFAHKVIDTFCIAKGIKLGIPYKPPEDFTIYQYKVLHKKVKATRCKLSDIGKDMGIEHDYDSLHDATSDLELNIKVWNKLKLQIDL